MGIFAFCYIIQDKKMKTNFYNSCDKKLCWGKQESKKLSNFLIKNIKLLNGINDITNLIGDFNSGINNNTENIINKIDACIVDQIFED